MGVPVVNTRDWRSFSSSELTLAKWMIVRACDLVRAVAVKEACMYYCRGICHPTENYEFLQYLQRNL